MNAREVLTNIANGAEFIEHPRDGDCIHCLRRWIMIEVAQEVLLDTDGFEEPDMNRWATGWMRRWLTEVAERNPGSVLIIPGLVVQQRSVSPQEAADLLDLNPHRN